MYNFSVGQGYLTNIAPSEFQQFYEEQVPDSMKGRAFLERYGSHVDTATDIQEDADYPIRQATLHPIYENFRVQSFRQALLSEEADSARLMGELMFKVSHVLHLAFSVTHLQEDIIRRTKGCLLELSATDSSMLVGRKPS